MYQNLYVFTIIASSYCEFENFREGFIFEIKPSGKNEITLSFTDVGKSSPSRQFQTWQICLLTLFAKIKFSGKVPN